MSMKCLVVGAGAQGAAAAAILSRAADVEAFTLADYDEGAAAKLRDKLAADPKADAGKITVAGVDARDAGGVARLAAGCDVILNFVHMDFSATIRKAALAAGCHYVDTASDLKWQHDVAFEHRVADDAAFKAAGLTALSGSGDTPGVANALCRYAADQLDEVDELVIRLGYAFEGGDPDRVYFGFDPGWSPEVALQDFHDKACVFTGGRPTMQGPFANPETFRFPDPVGEMLICSHSHDESYTMPVFIGKGIKECDFKYGMDQAAGTLVAMGFGDPQKVIELGDGTKVRPFEVAMKLTPRPGENSVVTEAETRRPPHVDGRHDRHGQRARRRDREAHRDPAHLRSLSREPPPALRHTGHGRAVGRRAGGGRRAPHGAWRHARRRDARRGARPARRTCVRCTRIMPLTLEVQTREPLTL